MNNQQEIEIEIETQYLEQDSLPEQSRFVFAYHIVIHNLGPEVITLKRRYWKITDADEQVQTVEGEGVVGQQPTIEVGESFSYSSGAVIATEIGTMEGHYQLETQTGEAVTAEIPAFTLANPKKLH